MKKKTPLILLKTVDKILLENSDIVKVLPRVEERRFYHIVDRENEEFSFIISFGQKEGDYAFSKTPAHEANMGAMTGNSSVESLRNHLVQWVGLIKEYNSTPSVYDDLILKSHEENYYTEFKIVDDDRFYTVFDPQRLILIDSFLQSSVQKLEEVRNEKNEEQISDIINEVKSLGQELPNTPKEQVIRRISKIFAKGTKHQGIDFAKILLKEFYTKVAKTLIEKGYQWGQTAIFKGFLESQG